MSTATDGDKIAAAILAAKSTVRGTDLKGYITAYREALALIAEAPTKRA